MHSALLVAPPYLDPDWILGPDDRPGEHFPRFVHRERLPLRTIVVASRTDPWATYEQSATYASDWGAELVDAGDAGHLDTAAGYGPWPAGERLLADLLGRDPRVR
ncbi:alpha/beta hydrolase [Micromonospora sp. NPDC049523]|uniref:RBBP9/YdeN family alpha/beta hydrolase n=1 Tax=Micromonospora sp. NPDC049523 TaxID=3155921 RepID=UPI003415C507